MLIAHACMANEMRRWNHASPDRACVRDNRVTRLRWFPQEETNAFKFRTKTHTYTDQKAWFYKQIRQCKKYRRRSGCTIEVLSFMPQSYDICMLDCLVYLSRACVRACVLTCGINTKPDKAYETHNRYIYILLCRPSSRLPTAKTCWIFFALRFKFRILFISLLCRVFSHDCDIHIALHSPVCSRDRPSLYTY